MPDDPALAPLPADAPDWRASRDSDPDYEALSAEITRMSSMTDSGAAPTDWKLIAKTGESILSKKAKDIQVAGYAAVALFKTGGLAGFLRGVKILASLFGPFSDSAFPPPARKRARVNAVEWWLEHADEWINSLADVEVEQEFHDDLVAAVQDLDNSMAESLADSAPILAGLKSGVARIPVKAPPPEPAAAADAAEAVTVETVETDAATAQIAIAPPTAAPAAAPSSPPASAPGKTPDQALREIRGILADARDMAQPLAANTGDHLPYRLRRWAAWATLRAAPPAERGRTMLPPPESHVVQSLNSLIDSGDYPTALRVAEEQVGVHLFWLDPHRVAANALMAMGQSHQAAMNAVQDETLSFARRLPALTRLAFSDGTPFADPRTKTWLSSLTESGGGSAEVNETVKEAMEKARGAAAVNPEEALDLLFKAGQSAGHPRDALLLRIEMLKVFSAAGRREAVRAQIPALLAVLDKYSLDAWEPGLAAQALAAGIGGLEEEEDAQLLGVLRQRLALAAPSQYIRL